MTLVDLSVWPNAYRPLVCTCGDLEAAHAIRSNGSRGACSVSRGPAAVPCGCKTFTPKEVAS